MAGALIEGPEGLLMVRNRRRDGSHDWSTPGGVIDRGETVPARARIEALIEWAGPVAEEIGAAPFLDVPLANAAERQRARRQEGASFEQIYAEQVQAGERACQRHRNSY